MEEQTAGDTPPLDPDASARIPVEPASGPRNDPTSTRRVLVVEDNEINYELASALLEMLGHQVIWARDGEQGLQMAVDQLPDLVVLDLHMPKLSGHEVLKALRGNQRTSSVPVLVLSADAMLGTGQSVMDYGASAYLSKPFDLRAFQATVSELLP